MKNRAIIIGAGPAGLVTANELAKQGWKVDIYEALDRVGGMCRTVQWNGYSLDIGPHVFHTPDKKLSEYWQDNFGDLLVEGEYWSQNVQGKNYDEYYDYPLSWESISSYPKNIKQNIIAEIKSTSVEGRSAASNYREYMDAIAGKTLRKMFFERYPEKIWGVSVNDMTADWAPKRVNIFDKKSPFFNGQWTAIGKNGAGAVYERIAKNIKKNGGNIFLNKKIKSLNISNGVIDALNVNNKNPDNNIKIEKSDVVISTLPIINLVGMLGIETTLTYRGVMIFYLDCLKKKILPKGISWSYYDAKEIYFSRVTEPEKMGLKMPSEERTLLTVEVPYTVNDDLDKNDVEKIKKDIVKQIERVGLLSEEDVVDIKVIKEKYVYPVQNKGYKNELAKLNKVIGGIRQLYSFGAGGEFNYADTQIIFEKSFDFASELMGSDSNAIRTIKDRSITSFSKVINTERISLGGENDPYIIAEAGMNHNGSLKIGKLLIDEAIKASCNAIKFQTFLPNSRVSSKIKSAHYAEEADGIEENLYQMFSRLAMPFDEQKKLFDYAKKSGIEVFSTPFDVKSVDFLEEMEVNLYKIASMDLVNLPLIEYVAKTKKPIILSTGMSDLGMIEDALEVIAKSGNKNVALLHCNSTYPAAEEDMNIEAINTLKRCFDVPVGLSDHSFGLTVSQIALSIGADIIERHFTLDSSLEGPDHILSSEPEEMAQLTNFSKRVKGILGDGKKIVRSSEFEAINLQRKSLYAGCSIKAGQIITSSMVEIKGPSGGVLPKYLDIVIGRKAKKSIEKDYPITWDDI